MYPIKKNVHKKKFDVSNILCVFQPLSDVVMHVERGYRMEAPDGCPQEIYSIMMLAWEIDPKQRPTFKQVLEKLNNLRATTV
jgi:c-src tyrosine kinase